MLGVILGNTQLAKLHTSPESRIYEYCSTIEKATARAADFVKQLLAFSSRQVLELKAVDLEEALVSFTKMIQRVIGEHIDMNMILSPELPKIKADVTQINQVLLNLVVNARDAMSEGGKLTLETYAAQISREYSSFYPDLEPGDYVVLSVTDTGCGIPRNNMNKIYEPFFTTKTSGSGLGLSVVYGIVKQHKGFINVYSEPDKGTTFKVYIPSIGEAGVENGDAVEISIKGGDETILIVEDDEDMRKIVSEILQSLGYNIIIASNGEEGLEIFTERHDEIDFVILDVVMPKLGGREVYEGIKKIKPDVACLFVTGYSLNGSHTDFILEEGIEVLQKPYSFEDIAVKIRGALDKRKEIR
jgi:CheY-like chemotaxis protein/two-component sensor histidine kinase